MIERVPIQSALGVSRHKLIQLDPLGDFINSEEYREPDWLVKMKELKKKLAGKLAAVGF